ncbi:hypothetical protein ABTY96_12340 [Streptomyces sp. NPDC096057]|uniref:hypothetical protein n=1 Tax=Streptomyces sp. NPDC096057 TaxID=3155543 RepID=UPI00332CDD25
MSNVREYGRHYIDSGIDIEIDIKFVAESIEGTPVMKELNRSESWAWYPLNSPPSPQFLPAELSLNSYHSGKLYNP